MIKVLTHILILTASLSSWAQAQETGQSSTSYEDISSAAIATKGYYVGPSIQQLQAIMETTSGSGALGNAYKYEQKAENDFKITGMSVGYDKIKTLGWGYDTHLDYLKKSNVDTGLFDFTFSYLHWIANAVYSINSRYQVFAGANVLRFVEPAVIGDQFGVGFGAQVGAGALIGKNLTARISYMENYSFAQLTKSGSGEKVADLRLKMYGPSLGIYYLF